jgi:hypothetical protein
MAPKVAGIAGAQTNGARGPRWADAAPVEQERAALSGREHRAARRGSSSRGTGQAFWSSTSPAAVLRQRVSSILSAATTMRPFFACVIDPPSVVENVAASGFGRG